MYHYLFTNDLRISTLDKSLQQAATCYLNNNVPTATEDKSANNNIKTLGFYFNLDENSNCSKLAASGHTRSVVLNFIKKFQYPNLRTKLAYEESKADGIRLAPMRLIVKLLFMANLSYEKAEAYLTKDEIKYFIFYNDAVAKSKKVDLLSLMASIIEYRKSNKFPTTVVENESEHEWKQEDRQIREMLKVLKWSGCIKEEGDKFLVDNIDLSQQDKADIFDIISYNSFWDGDTLESYKDYMDMSISDEKNESYQNREITFRTQYQSKFPQNRILFGAPGTGKSYTLNKETKELIGRNNESDYERVTFHPDYSYAQFVGTYKPVSEKKEDGKDIITYKYVPGPFMRTYVRALKNICTDSPRPFLLIIEEINRANVAAVFGDIFQLLDRGDDGVSEYPIQASEDIKNYLCSELGGNPEDYEKIRIPNNMFIWATMNSADQGVFPMDTAFKRRWDFTYLGIDDSDEQIRGKYVYLAADKSQKVEWNKLRKAINNFLAKQKINEDKQLGPYFISKNIVVPENGDEIDRDKFIRVFKNKVIMYLFEDAARQKRPSLFEGCSQNSGRYSEICRAFEAEGIKIFNTDIQNESELEDMTSRSEGNE